MGVLYTPDEVSKRLGVSKETLREWRGRSKGKGPRCFKVGRKIHYPAEWLAEFLQEKSTEGDPRRRK
jgi:transposase